MTMLGVLCTGLKESAMLVCAANLPRSCSVSGTATRPTYSEATNASSGLNICDGDSAMIMDQLKAFKAENIRENPDIFCSNAFIFPSHF